MEQFTDEEVVRELLRRLEAKDRANHDLLVITKKLEDLNKKLVESEKLKSNFLSNIRNEINNPLTFVLSMCELLSTSGITDPETLKTSIATIHKEAFNLNFQLANIFAAAELEAGDASIAPSAVDIPALLASSVDSLKHRADEKNVSMGLDLSADLKDNAIFRTDAEKLQCVMSNLLANAIEYSYAGGAVEIRAARWEAGLEITVVDHGVGIDPGDHDLIFERFRQLDYGATKAHAGHGLGLSVTKAMVELLNGSVAVRSDRGAGASFTLVIPESANDTGGGTYSADGNNFFFEDASEENERF